MFKKKKKNYNPDAPKMCLYCENATVIADEENILCSEKGIVNKEFCCKRFAYDPLKRLPKPTPPMPKLNVEDLLI